MRKLSRAGTSPDEPAVLLRMRMLLLGELQHSKTQLSCSSQARSEASQVLSRVRVWYLLKVSLVLGQVCAPQLSPIRDPLGWLVAEALFFSRAAPLREKNHCRDKN